MHFPLKGYDITILYIKRNVFGVLMENHEFDKDAKWKFCKLRLSLLLQKCKNKRTGALSLWHQQQCTMVDIYGPLQTRGETRCPGEVSVSCFASRIHHECPRHKIIYVQITKKILIVVYST